MQALPLAAALGAPPARARPLPARLPRLEQWDDALKDAARAGHPVVILWGTPGCPWCDALRADVMVHVWREAVQRGVRVHEFDLTDRRPLEGAPTLSPAELADRLTIRVSPTVSFHGPGGELAPRLIGYPSRDFYPAYLEDRLQQARNKLRP
jgi:thioredoxin-related protein